MYIIFNNVEGKNIGEFNKDSEFIDFVNKIKIKNEDFEFSIISTSDAIEYIEDFCSNLELK